MKKEIGGLWDELCSLSSEHKVIVWAMISMFLPFFITVPVLVFTVFYMVKEDRLKDVLKKTPYAFALICFMTLTLIVSLYYKNWWGVGLGIGLCIIMLVCMYYRFLATKSLFDLIIRIGVLLMMICGIAALFEYAYRIIVMLDWDITTLPIPSKRQYRIRVGFFNANYYAMMLEFTILLCVYKLKTVKEKSVRFYYLVAMLLQLFVLYLTGSRTGMVAAIGGIGVMILFLTNRYIIALFTGGCACLCGLFLVKPSLFPRVTFLERNFKARFQIWEGAINCFKEHPFFGQGPFTYYHNYLASVGTNHEMYKTQHAHNLLLDPLASFGIVGCILFVIYLFGFMKELWYLLKHKIDASFVALVIGAITVTILHGIFDFTLFWIQTSMLFFFLLGSMSMYMPKHPVRQSVNEA